jgi:translation initiation factor 2B subunit (eIF-2B alpha/beta/delta family)/8-oxo-dGTP pyrophosphatase MutT (NUDIX family)
LDYRHVVTSFIQVSGKILLLRRSSKVGTYRGKWAAVSGYLEGNEDPAQRALIEIREETGLTSAQVKLVRVGGPLSAYDETVDMAWVVHPFLFEARESTVHLDWENTEFQWVRPDALREYETVPKLREAFDRVRWDLQTTPTALSEITRQVQEIAQDRTHGANYLGLRAIEIMKEVSRLSDATSPSNLFHDLLLAAFQLRNAQPSMATLRNLVGKLLYRLDSHRYPPSSVDEFRQLVRMIADEQISSVKRSLDEVCKNCSAFMPENCRVLTHSYSSTVRKALEIAHQSGKRLQVYVTESQPGGEGTQLTKDFSSKGIQARLVPDIKSLPDMPAVDLVLVGSDSVMADGSIVNKIGTKTIAELSNQRSIPFYVVCETAKFNTFDFLGEPIKIVKSLFDLTPGKYVTKIITEQGAIEPRDVENRIRNGLREIYT